MSSISTSSLSIVDVAGRPRLVLHLAWDGEPELVFLGKDGNALIRLALTASIEGGNSLDKRYAAELHLGAIDEGPQLSAVVAVEGAAFVELASGPTDQFAAALAEVSHEAGVHAVKLLLRDCIARKGVEMSEGQIHQD